MSTGKGHPPRLKHWDYSTPAAYFVTMTVEGRAPVLSRIVEGRVELSAAGVIVRDCAGLLLGRFPISVSRLQVMPDHVHAIIVIRGEGARPDPVQPGWRPMMSDKSKLLGQVVRSWKAQATHAIRGGALPGFQWQSRFYEHVIRNRSDYQRVQAYIDDNPRRWRGR